MSVDYQDYYQILNVPREASQDEIQKAFRKLARKFHPDVSKEKNAEDKFKRLNEAYEVLKDPEKRKLYDSLGHNWKQGQEFRPPPGWEDMFRGAQRGGQSRPGGMHFEFKSAGSPGSGAGLGGFSDFFETIFGGLGGSFGPGMGDVFGDIAGSTRTQGKARTHKATPISAELQITIEDAYNSATRQVNLNFIETRPDGSQIQKPKSYKVKIPPGTREGSSIRLSGEGGAGRDLLFKVSFAPHPRFKSIGFDLESELQISPWEAALGARVEAKTVDGRILLIVKPSSQSGQRLRVTGKGLPKNEKERGDLYYELKIVVQKELSKAEEDAYRNLEASSKFNPRAGQN